MHFGKYPMTKASVMLDDQELEIVIQALKLATVEARHQGNMFRSRMNEMLTLKIMADKMRYQDYNISLLEEKYGL